MAGEDHQDPSFFDFLVEDPEVLGSTPSGHLDYGGRPQQPTAVPNRTSDERQLPMAPRHLPASASAPSPLDLHLNLHLDRSQESRVAPSSLGLDVHTTLAYAGPATPLAHAPVGWGLYDGLHAPSQFNVAPAAFNLAAIPPPHVSHSHAHAHAQPQPQPHPYDTTLAHLHGHAHPGHYAFAVPWADDSGQDVSTPTLASPVAPISSNPWIDPDDGEVADELPSRHEKRSKRHKKNSPHGSDSTAGPSSAGEPASPGSYSLNSRASLGSKSTSLASTSTTSSRHSKLRSASRTSKNSHHRPTDSPEERRTRASHNLVEKQYRNRLNAQFESLLHALPEQLRSGGADADESDAPPISLEDKRVSKGEVLEMARKHIQVLERERNQLEREKNELLENLQQLKGSSSEGGASSSATPIDFEIDMNDADDATGDRSHGHCSAEMGGKREKVEAN